MESTNPEQTPAQPSPTSTPPPGQGVPPVQGGSGLPPNVAAGLAELFPLIGGIIFYSLDRQNALVRFHSMQSIYFGAAWLVLSVVFFVLSWIPIVNFLVGIVWFLAGLGAFILWLIAVVNAFGSREWEMPVLGRMVRDQLAGTTPRV
jgi:uncharacterized membrane protein